MWSLITPQAQISISIDVLDNEDNVLLRETYSSGVTDGDTYALSTNPGDRINKVTHEIITDLLNRAARQIYVQVSNIEN